MCILYILVVFTLSGLYLILICEMCNWQIPMDELVLPELTAHHQSLSCEETTRRQKWRKLEKAEKNKAGGDTSTTMQQQQIM